MMAQFRVRYGSRTRSHEVSEIRGEITVTEDTVRLVTRTPLVSRNIVFLIYFGGILLILLGPAFYCLFEPTLGVNPSPPPPFFRPLFFGGLSVWMSCMFLCILDMTWPIRKRRMTLQRGEITGVETLARELLVSTTTQPITATMRTTDDAQALATALREGTATPITFPIRVGRESLFDQSGFNGMSPVNVSVGEEQVTLEGARPSTLHIIVALGLLLAGTLLPLPLLGNPPETFLHDWGILIWLACFFTGVIGCVAILSCGKREVRTLPCGSLRGVTALHRYVTFLSPDAKLGERRYTLKAASPEEASLLARHLQEAEAGPMQGTYRPAIPKKHEETARVLRRVTAENYTHSGQVLIDRKQMTFIGRSGLAHTWAWRVAFLFTLLMYPLLMSVVGQHVVFLYLLDAHDQHRVIHIASMLLACICVYLPATAILTRAWSKRIVVPRHRITQATRLGRQITLTICSRFNATIQPLILSTETDDEADALAEALFAQQG